MKKWLVILIFALCCIPVPVYASGNVNDFSFELGGGDWYHGSVAPGDVLEDTVVVENASGYPLKFRLVRTENLHESGLYEVMMYSLGGSEYGRLSGLDSDWIRVGAGETLELPVKGYLPETLGNEWQGKELNVRFYFEGRLVLDEPNEPDKPVPPDEPNEPDKPAPPDEPNEPDKPDKPAPPETPVDPEPDLPDEPRPSWDTDLSGDAGGHYKSIAKEPQRVTAAVDKTGKRVVVKAAKTGEGADILVHGILLMESVVVMAVYGRKCVHGRKKEEGVDSCT